MKLQQRLLAGVLSLGLLLGSQGCVGSDGLTVNLSEQQIESSMASYFPMKKDLLFGQVQLEISGADLVLKNGSQRADLLLASKVSARSKTFPGNIHVSFGLDYDPELATFYLVEPRVEEVQIAGLPTAISGTVTEYVLPLVQQYFKRVAVYTLDEKRGTGQQVARKTLKKVSIQDKNLVLLLGLAN